MARRNFMANFTVLMRFRQYQFAFSADIEGMLLQFGYPPCDQISLQFFWREDTTSDVEVLQYTWQIFGARDSPTCAMIVLQQTTRDNYESFPEASRAVLTRFYMDDHLDSFENRNDAMRTSKYLVKLHNLGGF